MDVPADSNTSIPSELRQRMLSRASAFAEGVRPSTPKLSRRRSSLLSNLSDAQQSLRSSTDNLHRASRHNDMDKLVSSDDTTWWDSSPVFIVIIPAVAALTHPNGGAVATDLVMLLLSAWLLSKCADAPWKWYIEARQRQYVEIDDSVYDDTIHEEDEECLSDSLDRPDSAAGPPDISHSPAKAASMQGIDAQSSARNELRRTELLAFAACFVGPLLGAYLLHNIRSRFSHRTQDDIVTDLNLTIYVMGAEIRPISRLMKMVNERTLYLQRVVTAESQDQSRPSSAHSLQQRLAELEARFEGPLQSNTNVDVTKIAAEVRQSIQLQLDALNRAVRKYEKRHMAQSIQIEARFQEIDIRLKDTLSLAAAAARTGQKPGIVAAMLSWIAGVFTYTLQTTWDISTYPFRVIASLVETVKSLFIKDGRTSRRRTKVYSNGYPSIPSTPRVQSKSGR
ncbi:hypothetical protein BDU57DRAFT_518363 [Ampelomyces quisqualis]|uniref:Uncharacterized protein n=1 Tax=Ampelomyces quisqualis TaxID=50730 RepID=A0A6A5QII5_AMPQU|nr:hypothetical protein BDU57DRAFT_518363 [Ampelomyces quisqualis]